MCSLFFFNDTATTEIYTLSLHDALPISTSKASRAQEHDTLVTTGRRYCRRWFATQRRGAGAPTRRPGHCADARGAQRCRSGGLVLGGIAFSASAPCVRPRRFSSPPPPSL